MTAIINSIATISNKFYTDEEVHEKFLTMYPLIRKVIGKAFGGYKRHIREEAIQNSLAWAYDLFMHLVWQGKMDLAYATPIAKYAIQKHRNGRIAGVSRSSTDVLSEATLALGRSDVRQFERVSNPVSRRDVDDSEETKVLNFCHLPTERTMTFYLDFEAWYLSQSEHHQRIIFDLAKGESTNDVAHKYGCSAGRISQLRRKFEQSWSEYISEKELVTA
jgi:hypothetical protein